MCGGSGRCLVTLYLSSNVCKRVARSANRYHNLPKFGQTSLYAGLLDSVPFAVLTCRRDGTADGCSGPRGLVRTGVLWAPGVGLCEGARVIMKEAASAPVALAGVIGYTLSVAAAAVSDGCV